MGLERPHPEHAGEHEQKRQDAKGDPPWDLAAARCTRHALPLSISLRELYDQSPAVRRPRWAVSRPRHVAPASSGVDSCVAKGPGRVWATVYSHRPDHSRTAGTP